MPAKGSGITSLSKLRLRCSIAERTDPECCWLWKGAVRQKGKQAAIWVVLDGKGKVLTAPNAAALLSGKPIPEGGRAWATCGNPTCCNPRHAATGTYAEWGAWMRESGVLKTAKNKAAALARGRRRSSIDLAIARRARESAEPATAVAIQLSEELKRPVSVHALRKARRGGCWVEPSPFQGLGA